MPFETLRGHGVILLNGVGLLYQTRLGVATGCHMGVYSPWGGFMLLARN
ncbi:hypothetical protein Z948_1940 [Sulfitobacter donghicola DSW-25 = KCTC 12864 = JCM 14565]|nr:hypothetical protein Z948_1940 [Sulfitobacter donghicola DSW-25 = KCTC 12864 = JCM 14565]